MSQLRQFSESFLAHGEPRTQAPPAPESGTFLTFLAELAVLEATMMVVLNVEEAS